MPELSANSETGRGRLSGAASRCWNCPPTVKREKTRGWNCSPTVKRV